LEGSIMAVAEVPWIAEEPAISVRNLSKKYDIRSAPEEWWLSLLLPRYISAPNRLEHWVLREASFDVPRGRRLALVGENGSGKSTLLKMLAGLIRPTAGELTVRGSLLPLLELGAGFHPELNGYENVFLQASIMGMPRSEIRQRLPDIVEFAELGDFMDTPVKYYSSGMFARLGFSVAIHCTPDILLVDEILSVGDPDFQDKSFHKMMEFVSQGRTLILVSHSLLAVKEICDDAIWLDAGRIREMGPAHEVVESYMIWGRERTKQFEPARRLNRNAPKPIVAHVPACCIAGVRFLDGDGQPAERVVSGRPMGIEIECVLGEAIEHAGCRVLFYAGKDRPALEIHSFSQGENLRLRAGRNTIRAAVESFAARQCEYRVEVEILYQPPGCAAATLDTARSAVAVVNPDGIETNYLLNLDWRFEFKA
jgi:ABC-type polysaccharide/polyol phosphate transport system ATPase subunit